MEKLGKNTDNKQECNERYYFASLQKLEFKYYTLNSAVLMSRIGCGQTVICGSGRSTLCQTKSQDHKSLSCLQNTPVQFGKGVFWVQAVKI